MSTSRVNRRDFLRRASALAAGGTGIPYFCLQAHTQAQQFQSPNDRPRTSTPTCSRMRFPDKE